MNVILPNNKDITNEELLKDIEVTKVEIEAYRNIANGYKALASLPEQNTSKSRLYRLEERNNNILASDCSRFLEALLKLKEKRGI